MQAGEKDRRDQDVRHHEANSSCCMCFDTMDEVGCMVRIKLSVNHAWLVFKHVRYILQRLRYVGH